MLITSHLFAQKLPQAHGFNYSRYPSAYRLEMMDYYARKFYGLIP